ncbi:MAG: hypothetical protein IRZ28_16315 [Steroidobacteraceae bacterium]|nr:hypothetical protein [Steroidobacteraceae bacterium]
MAEPAGPMSSFPSGSRARLRVTRKLPPANRALAGADSLAENERRSLQALLENYVRHGSGLGVEWVEHEFGWPRGVLDLARLEIFEGFQWACLQSRTDSSILGIRAADGANVFSARAMRTSGVTVCSLRTESLAERLGRTRRFVVAELAGSTSFCVSVFAHRPPTTWQLIEQRVMKCDVGRVTARGA